LVEQRTILVEQRTILVEQRTILVEQRTYIGTVQQQKACLGNFYKPCNNHLLLFNVCMKLLMFYNITMLPPIALFGYVFSWYWLIMSITIINCIVFFRYYHKKRYPNLELLSVGNFIFRSISIILSGFFLSKLFSLIEYLFVVPHDMQDLYDATFRCEGMRWYGVVVGYSLVFYLFCKTLIRLQWYKLIDTFATTACLGITLGKFACLLEGHGCYGIYTNLPWGMHFAYGNSPSILPVHPTPLYDSMLHGFLFFMLLKIDKVKLFDGYTYVVFIIGTSVANILVEIVRNNDRIIASLSVAQCFYLFAILIAVLTNYRIRQSLIT
jgi:prolipoprotein diacylglyceryltransferase